MEVSNTQPRSARQPLQPRDQHQQSINHKPKGIANKSMQESGTALATRRAKDSDSLYQRVEALYSSKGIDVASSYSELIDFFNDKDEEGGSLLFSYVQLLNDRSVSMKKQGDRGFPILSTELSGKLKDIAVFVEGMLNGSNEDKKAAQVRSYVNLICKHAGDRDVQPTKINVD